MRHSIAILALFLSSACSISNTNQNAQAERWSRQIDNLNFPPPTVNSNNGDWIPINPGNNNQNDRANNGRVLNFGSQVFAQQNQQVFPPPSTQFLQQTQFIPPTFPANDLISNGQIPQQQAQAVNQYPTILTDHRFAIPNGQFIQHGPPPPQAPPQTRPPKVTAPFQFEFNNQQLPKSPFFQQLPPQFVNDQFLDIPENRPNQKAPQPPKPIHQDNFKFDSKFQNQQQSQRVQGPELLHHPPPPPPPPQQIQHQQLNQFQQSKPQQIHSPQDEVQLLYVPLETYYQQQQHQNQQGHIPPPGQFFNGLPQFVNPAHINEFYTPAPPVRTLNIQTTTAAPSPSSSIQKQKPHQPPLAMFMLQDKKSLSKDATINDILVTLKQEKSISVLDAVPDNSPKIFIGPSGLKTPTGYNKFELPYLSSIEHNRSERKLEQTPFFVAPLSYRAPDGFTKIPLPSPHVGSVVLNELQMVQTFGPPPTTARPEVVTPFTRKYSSNFLSATPLPQKFDPLTMKYITPVTEDPFKSSPEPVRQIQKTKPEKAVKQSFKYEAPIEQQFESTGSFDGGSHVVNEEYFNFQKSSPKKKQQFSNNLDESFNEQRNSYNQFQQNVDQQSGTVFNDQPKEVFKAKTSAKPKERNPEPEFNSRQPSTTVSPLNNYSSFSRTPGLVENYQFSTPSSVIQKNQYHNEYPSTSSAPQEYYEEVNQFDYNGRPQTPATKKPKTKPSQKSTLKFSSVKSVAPVETGSNQQIIEKENPFPSVPSRDVHFYNHQVVQQYEKPQSQRTENNQQSNPSPSSDTPSDIHFYNPQYINQYEQPRPQAVLPLDNSQSNAGQYYGGNQYDQQRFEEVSPKKVNQYNSEIPLSDITTPESYDYTTTENYKLPSELPPINANLPNMINSLMEDNEDKEVIREPSSTTTNEPHTRRPVVRGRRPLTRITTTTQNFENEIDSTTTRRPIQRTRTRPTRPANQEYRTSTLVRNPIRVRFNPSNEERQQLQRNRGGDRVQGGGEKNLEYQRDVLNQNYPVITSRPTTSTSTTEKLQYTQEVEQESPYSYNENVVTIMAEPYQEAHEYSSQSGPSTTEYFHNTESLFQNENTGPIQENYFDSNQNNQFSGMNVHMEVPQDSSKQFNDRKQVETVPQNLPENHEEDGRIVLIGDKPRKTKVQPVYVQPSTTTTTTTEAPTTTSEATSTNALFRGRRPGFVRRPVRPSANASDRETPTTTEASNQERYTIRARSRGEATTQRVPQIRGRVRAPVLRTTTPSQDDKTEDEQPAERKPIYRSQYRSRLRPKFNLETQETQWSGASQNSFQPIENIEDFITRKYDSDEELVDNEPEIITAGPETDEETYLFNVTPRNQKPISEAKPAEETNNSTETQKLDLASVPEVENEIAPRFEDSESKRYSASHIETTTEPKGKRRGVWRKIRVRPVDTFETAESQHVGQKAYNVLTDEYRGKTETKLSYNSFAKDNVPLDDFTKAFGGGRQAALEMTTISNDVSKEEDQTETTENLEETTKLNEVDYTTEYENGVEIPTTFQVGVNIEQKQELEEELEKEMLLESTTIVAEVEQPLTEISSNDSKSTKDEEVLISKITTTTESVFDEVRKKLTDLFTKPENEDNDVVVETTTNTEQIEEEVTTMPTIQEDRSKLDYVDEETTEQAIVQEVNEQPDVRANVTEVSPGTFVIATSTSKEVSHETEICYRGRCIKSVEATKN